MDVSQLAPANPGILGDCSLKQFCLTEQEVLKLIVWQGWALEKYSWTKNRVSLSGFTENFRKFLEIWDFTV